MATPVTLRWVPTEDDLRQAYSARRYALGFRRREYVVIGIIFAVAVGLAVLGATAVAFVLAVVGVVFAFPGTAAALAGRSIRRLWRANPFLAEPVETRLADDGYHQHSDNRDVSLAWAGFSSWIDGPEVLVLNLSETGNGTMITVPKRAANAAQLDAARSLLRERLGAPLAG